MAYSVDPKVISKKLEAAFKLLEADSATREKFESVRVLLKGINPRTDNLLAILSREISQIEKLQKGHVIELTADLLPEVTQEQKKRKRRILAFIKTWKDLKGELARVQKEFSSGQSGEIRQSSADRFIRIASFAKGPFGIITIFAVVIIGAALLIGGQNRNSATSNKSADETIVPTGTGQKIQAIKVGEKMIAISELTTGQGTECMSGKIQATHYHAKNHAKALATDGTYIPDPGGCGYGKVNEVEIVYVE